MRAAASLPARLLILTVVMVAATVAVARATAANDDAVVEGRLVGIASSVYMEEGMPPTAPAVSLGLAAGSTFVTVAVTAETEITDAAGRRLTVQDLGPDDVLRAAGVWQTPTHLLAARIERVGH